MGEGVSAGAAVGQAIVEQSVQNLLGPDEEVLACVFVRPMSPIKKLFVGCLDVTGPGPEMTKKMAVAVTPRRVLVLGCHGFADEAKEVLWDVPLAEVQSIEERGGLNTSKVTWSAGGRDYTVSADGAGVKRLARALGGSQS